MNKVNNCIFWDDRFAPVDPSNVVKNLDALLACGVLGEEKARCLWHKKYVHDACNHVYPEQNFKKFLGVIVHILEV